jgi:hypothetical protein
MGVFLHHHSPLSKTLLKFIWVYFDSFAFISVHFGLFLSMTMEDTANYNEKIS